MYCNVHDSRLQPPAGFTVCSRSCKTKTALSALHVSGSRRWSWSGYNPVRWDIWKTIWKHWRYNNSLDWIFWQSCKLFLFCLQYKGWDNAGTINASTKRQISHLKVYFNEGLQLERLFINLLFTNWALIWKLRHCNLILTHMSENNETNYRENCIPYCKRPILFIMTRITSHANIDGSYFKNLDSSFISIIIFITN